MYGMRYAVLRVNIGFFESGSVWSDSLRPHELYSPWNSSGQNTGVGSLSLLQGIFPTQESNPGLQHCRWILCQLSHKGGPRNLEWVAYPFSRGSSRSRNRTGASCIAGRFFTSWATREALRIGGKRQRNTKTTGKWKFWWCAKFHELCYETCTSSIV